ncbi:MAG: hypothetical protein WCS43_10200 [Verrucomicrobiota bacterium]
MSYIIYFVLFLVAYTGIGILCTRMGIVLPATAAVSAGDGVVHFQLVQIILANIVAGSAMKAIS